MLFLYKGISAFHLLLFIGINIVLKMIPIYTLWKLSVKPQDNYFYLGMFIVYFLWLVVNDVDIWALTISYFQPFAGKNNLSFTPLSNVLIEWFQFLFSFTTIYAFFI
jgi:hypothetical protein